EGRTSLTPRLEVTIFPASGRPMVALAAGGHQWGMPTGAWPSNGRRLPAGGFGSEGERRGMTARYWAKRFRGRFNRREVLRGLGGAGLVAAGAACSAPAATSPAPVTPVSLAPTAGAGAPAPTPAARQPKYGGVQKMTQGSSDA